jgi:integrase
MAQEGNITLRGNCWLLRYYEPVLENGKVVKRPRSKKLATFSKEYKTINDVRPLAALILAPINARTARPESRQGLAEFIEHVYLPYVKTAKRPSTYRSYTVSWRLLQLHINGLDLKATTTRDIDLLLKVATSDKKRAHTTHRNLKNFLSAGFRYAIRQNMVSSNPVRDAEIPRGKPAGQTKAYSLEEIRAILAVMPEPERTLVLVAGLTGLRKSEIKGLRWEDFRGNELHVQRSVWEGYVLDTKSLDSKAPVPVLPVVRKALEEHRKRNPDSEFIFVGATGKPLRIENVVRRDMKPILEEHGITWHGWHAFRRGLGTNLNALGADDKTIQTILRHSDVATTQTHYIKPIPKVSHAAMMKLEIAFKKTKKPARRRK